MSPLADIVFVALCLLMQGLFSGSEIAIVSSDRLVLKARADEGDKAAARVLRLLEQPTSLVGTCLMGANTATITGTTPASLNTGQMMVRCSGRSLCMSAGHSRPGKREGGSVICRCTCLMPRRSRAC